MLIFLHYVILRVIFADFEHHAVLRLFFTICFLHHIIILVIFANFESHNFVQFAGTWTS